MFSGAKPQESEANTLEGSGRGRQWPPQEELHSLGAHLYALEVSRNGNVKVTLASNGSIIVAERRRTFHLRGMMSMVKIDVESSGLHLWVLFFAKYVLLCYFVNFVVYWKLFVEFIVDTILD